MGTSIYAWIEYDEHGDAPFSGQPEVLPLVDWDDLRCAKDYRVFGALSGVRNSTGIDPLFPRRGMPPNPSWRVEQEIGKEDLSVSWLYPSEVHRALAHHGVSERELSLEMRGVLKVLDFFVEVIGDQRVRLVFEIE